MNQTTSEARSSIIKKDNDRHCLAIAYFNRNGWHLNKDELDLAAPDFTEAIRFEPNFTAALTKRSIVERRLMVSARADFIAALKLPQTNCLRLSAPPIASQRLAATEAAARPAVADDLKTLNSLQMELAVGAQDSLEHIRMYTAGAQKLASDLDNFGSTLAVAARASDQGKSVEVIKRR
jgi:hypothetical protein